MARLRAFRPIDMTDLSATIGRATYADEDLLIVAVGRQDTYYFGDFRYPNNEWRGTITGISVLESGRTAYEIRGLDISTRLATAAATRKEANSRALRDDDVIIGSRGDDRLDGYRGNDDLRGNSGGDFLWGRLGNDKLSGGPGNDKLFGNAGRDRLDGGKGNDRLEGGTGKDFLFGDDGKDKFVFSRGDGPDKIKRFEDGEDKIVFEKGVRKFEQLDISQKRKHTLIEYGDGDKILMKRFDADDLDSSDFIF